MPRSRILVAALAALALSAPTASADPAYYPGYPSPSPTAKDAHPRGPGHAIVMPERITDHDRPDTAGNPTVATRAELKARGRDGVQSGSLAGTTDTTAAALAQEQYYMSQAGDLADTTDATTAALAQEQYYASQAEDLAALVREQESTSGSGNQGVPRPDEDDAPWAIVGIGIGVAALGAGGLVVARRTRARVAA
jgi:hypothetical protein